MIDLSSIDKWDGVHNAIVKVRMLDDSIPDNPNELAIDNANQVLSHLSENGYPSPSMVDYEPCGGLIVFWDNEPQTEWTFANDGTVERTVFIANKVVSMHTYANAVDAIKNQSESSNAEHYQ